VYGSLGRTRRIQTLAAAGGGGLITGQVYDSRAKKRPY
jgi:hypothetical protein